MSSRDGHRLTGMGAKQIARLRTLEGRRVGVALEGGVRIDDCQLISAGRDRVATVWVFTNGDDMFLPIREVLDLWEIDAA